MNRKSVKDLMMPLSEYAVVSTEATLVEALQALAAAQLHLVPGQQPHRAVLIKNSSGKIVGKLGHLSFLKALEPRYNVIGDINKLTVAGLNQEFLDSVMESLNFWQDTFETVCQRAQHIKVIEVMKPIDQSIDENSAISDAIHQMILWQSISIPVSRGSKIVGVLRLSDLFDWVSEYIRRGDCSQEQEAKD